MSESYFEMRNIELYCKCCRNIKDAIIQVQYAAAKGTNRILLALYFAICKYLSANTRKDVWGEGALTSISNQLRNTLPGLRGCSATQLREMRLLFYEG